MTFSTFNRCGSRTKSKSRKRTQWTLFLESLEHRRLMAVVAGAGAEYFAIDESPPVLVGQATHETGKLAAAAPSGTAQPIASLDQGGRLIGLGPDGGGIMVSPEQWVEIQERQNKDDWFVGPEDADANSSDRPVAVQQNRPDAPIVPDDLSRGLIGGGYIGLGPDGGGIMVTPEEFERIQKEQANDDWFLGPEGVPSNEEPKVDDSNNDPKPATPKDDQAAPKSPKQDTDKPQPTRRHGYRSLPSDPATQIGKLHREIGELENELQRRQHLNEDTGDLAEQIAKKREQLTAEATRFGKTGTLAPSAPVELPTPTVPRPADEVVTIDEVDGEPTRRPAPNAGTSDFAPADPQLSKGAVDEIMRQFAKSKRNANRPESKAVPTTPARPAASQAAVSDAAAAPTNTQKNPKSTTSQSRSDPAKVPPHRPFSRVRWWWAAGTGFASTVCSWKGAKSGMLTIANAFTFGRNKHFSTVAREAQQDLGINSSGRRKIQTFSYRVARFSYYAFAIWMLFGARGWARGIFGRHVARGRMASRIMCGKAMMEYYMVIGLILIPVSNVFISWFWRMVGLLASVPYRLVDLATGYRSPFLVEQPAAAPQDE